MRVAAVALLLGCGAPLCSAAQCPASLYRAAGLSAGFNESIAHAIHSLTAEGLRLFNPKVTGHNGVPTVNRDMRSPVKVVEDAPEVQLPSDGFVTTPMRVISAVMSHLGEGKDGLGESWLPVERIVHEFHMRDLWHAIRPAYARVAASPPSAKVCGCLVDTQSNGIHAGVQWVAEQYKQWTPITLLNRPIPQLTDKASWNVWRDRITHYYDDQSLFDAATYLYCAVGANASAALVAPADDEAAPAVRPASPQAPPAPGAAAQCPASLYRAAGLSAGFNESIAHAIHSLTAEGLRLFNPRVTGRNGVPTVNRDMRSPVKVVEDAPEVQLPSDGFVTTPMRVISAVMSHLGEGKDGLGESWLPVERIVHEFHMRDLWHAIRPAYARVAASPPSAAVCGCLVDTQSNGIHAGVQWVAEQYKQWTPITLLNRPIPQLTDTASWNVWQERITHYYDDQSLFDAATYLYCAVAHL